MEFFVNKWIYHISYSMQVCGVYSEKLTPKSMVGWSDKDDKSSTFASNIKKFSGWYIFASSGTLSYQESIALYVIRRFSFGLLFSMIGCSWNITNYKYFVTKQNCVI